jgi:hypothetical protein
MSIKDIDFMFENKPVKIMTNRNCPEIQLVGMKVGPFEEGKEYEVKYWVAKELERSGIARVREEELLDAVKLHKIFWKESIQQARQVSPLEEDFYPKLRRYLASLKHKALSNPEKMVEYQKAKGLSNDIVNCRLKKIVSLASSPAPTNQTKNSLAREERELYKKLREIIDEWKSNIRKVLKEH